MKMIHRGEKGFTLIELLVVIAILGIIAAVVALSVAGFFGRGTLQAANTELHQAQTAIISAMAEAEGNTLVWTGGGADWPADGLLEWSGEKGTVLIETAGVDTDPIDAAEYVYGQFRAVYDVNADGAIIDGDCDYEGGWGSNIWFCTHYTSWADKSCANHATCSCPTPTT